MIPDDPTLHALDAIMSRAGFPVQDAKVRALAAEHRAGIEAALSDPDLNPQAKQRRVAEREAATVAKLAALHAEDRAAALKSVDQAEGEARRALLPPATPVASYASDTEKLLAAIRTEHALVRQRSMLADLTEDIADATDPGEISELAADVAAYGDPTSTTKALRAAVRRLEAIHKDTPEQQRGPAFAALVEAQAALKKHREAHPGPTRTLRAIERQRGTVGAVVDGFYKTHVPQLLKLGAATERQARTERATTARAALDNIAGAAR